MIEGRRLQEGVHVLVGRDHEQGPSQTLAAGTVTFRGVMIPVPGIDSNTVQKSELESESIFSEKL